MGHEGGQATVEWIGLVLVAALALGALAAVRAPGRDYDLATALAERLGCAAAGGGCAAPPHGRLADRAGGNGVPAPPAAAAGAGARRPPRARAVDALRRLRGAGELTKRIWIVCVGYRRFVYERDHPRAPTEPMPLGEALEIADACLNPLAFLEED